MCTLLSLYSALDILKAANQRSKHVRNAQSLIREQILEHPVCWGNFHNATVATFRPIERVPGRTPDFVSPSGSLYWRQERAYSDGTSFNGVIRMSNHRGMGIKSCDWYLDSNYGEFYATANNYELDRGFFIVAICAYQDFQKKH